MICAGSGELEIIDNIEFQLELTTAKWRFLTGNILGTIPDNRRWFGFTSLGEQLVVFGGWLQGPYSGGAPSNDVHLFNVSEMAWTEATDMIKGSAPPPRSRHGIASVNGQVYVFGGSSLNGKPEIISNAAHSICTDTVIAIILENILDNKDKMLTRKK